MAGKSKLNPLAQPFIPSPGTDAQPQQSQVGWVFQQSYQQVPTHPVQVQYQLQQNTGFSQSRQQPSQRPQIVSTQLLQMQQLQQQQQQLQLQLNSLRQQPQIQTRSNQIQQHMIQHHPQITQVPILQQQLQQQQQQQQQIHLQQIQLQHFQQLQHQQLSQPQNHHQQHHHHHQIQHQSIHQQNHQQIQLQHISTNQNQNHHHHHHHHHHIHKHQQQQQPQHAQQHLVQFQIRQPIQHGQPLQQLQHTVNSQPLNQMAGFQQLRVQHSQPNTFETPVQNQYPTPLLPSVTQPLGIPAKIPLFRPDYTRQQASAQYAAAQQDEHRETNDRSDHIAQPFSDASIWPQDINHNQTWGRGVGQPLGEREGWGGYQSWDRERAIDEQGEADRQVQFVVLIGPPASGKTTQATAICKHYSFDFLDIGQGGSMWKTNELDSKVRLVKQTQRPGLVIENVCNVAAARMVSDVCAKHGMTVGCVFMFEIDDMLELVARTRLKEGSPTPIPTTELFGPIREFTMAEVSLLEYYRTFPALYRIDANRPRSLVTTDILRIIDNLHGRRPSPQPLMLMTIDDDLPPLVAEQYLDFVPEGPSAILRFVRSKAETQKVFQKLQELLGKSEPIRTYPGALPTLLDVLALQKVCLGDHGTYSISKEVDGLPCLLLHISEGGTYLLDHSLTLYELKADLLPSPKAEWGDLLLDGELLVGTNCLMGWFIVSDALYISGQNKMDNGLLTRMEIPKKLFFREEDMANQSGKAPCVSLLTKTYYPLKDLKKLLKDPPDYPQLYEGLMFTPNTAPYRAGKDSGLYKWKSSPRSDFRLVINGDSPELHVWSGTDNDVREVLFYHIDTDFSNQQKIKRMLGKIVECLPLSNNLGNHQEWEIVRVRSFKTVPDRMEMVNSTLRSHLSAEHLLELTEQLKKQKGGRRRAGPERSLQLEDQPPPPPPTQPLPPQTFTDIGMPRVLDTLTSISSPDVYRDETAVRLNFIQEAVQETKTVSPPQVHSAPSWPAFTPQTYAEAVSGKPSTPVQSRLDNKSEGRKPRNDPRRDAQNTHNSGTAPNNNNNNRSSRNQKSNRNEIEEHNKEPQQPRQSNQRPPRNANHNTQPPQPPQSQSPQPPQPPQHKPPEDGPRRNQKYTRDTPKTGHHPTEQVESNERTNTRRQVPNNQEERTYNENQSRPDKARERRNDRSYKESSKETNENDDTLIVPTSQTREPNEGRRREYGRGRGRGRGRGSNNTEEVFVEEEQVNVEPETDRRRPFSTQQQYRGDNRKTYSKPKPRWTVKVDPASTDKVNEQ